MSTIPWEVHISPRDVYDSVGSPPCYYFCSPYSYKFTWPWPQGSSSAQTTICKSSVSAIDAAARDFLLAWPYQAWEISMSMYCPSNPTSSITYDGYFESFGAVAPTNDPCRVSVAVGATNQAGLVHTHPKFTTAAEYMRGNGCNNDQPNPPPTYEELQTINALNAAFSAADRNVAVSHGKPFYMRTPAGWVKKVNPNLAEYQVYP
jgi:hypothetical protein